MSHLVDEGKGVNVFACKAFDSVCFNILVNTVVMTWTATLFTGY